MASAASRLSTRARVSPARAGSPKRLKTRTTVPTAWAVNTASPPGEATTLPEPWTWPPKSPAVTVCRLMLETLR